MEYVNQGTFEGSGGPGEAPIGPAIAPDRALVVKLLKSPSAHASVARVRCGVCAMWGDMPARLGARTVPLGHIYGRSRRLTPCTRLTGSFPNVSRPRMFRHLTVLAVVTARSS